MRITEHKPHTKQKSLDDKQNIHDPLASSLNITNVGKYGVNGATNFSISIKKREISREAENIPNNHQQQLQQEQQQQEQQQPQQYQRPSMKTKPTIQFKRSNSKSNENIPNSHNDNHVANSATIPKYNSSNIDANFKLEDALGIRVKKRDKAIADMSYIFDSSLNKTSIPYYKEGNIDLYKSENLKKREALKTHKLVCDSIYKFMRVYQFNQEGKIDQNEYIRVHSKLAKILRKDLKDKGIKKLIEEEWKNDSKGRNLLDRQDIFNALFELVDVWAPDIDPFQYSGFYEKLFSIFMAEQNNGSQPDGSKNDSNPYDIMQQFQTKIIKKK